MRSAPGCKMTTFNPLVLPSVNKSGCCSNAAAQAQIKYTENRRFSERYKKHACSKNSLHSFISSVGLRGIKPNPLKSGKENSKFHC